MRRHFITLAATLVTAAVSVTSTLIPRQASAQIPVNETWFTIATPHFRVHFTKGTEVLARRAAAAAERAYANLATELAPPRGLIDVVLTDATDASNGAATTFPRNHVIIQARPPVDQTSLESYDDWMVLVLQHEVTHVFQLDRSLGWWGLAQHIFGRNPVLFPGNYTPSWLTEGLAVYYESRFTSGGRLDGTYQYDIARAAALEHAVPSLDELSLLTSRYPYGQTPYVYGAFIFDDMSRHHGPASVPRFIHKLSKEPVPFLLDYVAQQSFGESFSHAWKAWRDSVIRNAPPTPTINDWHVIPNGGRYLIHPRWHDDSTAFYFTDDGRESPGMYTVSPTGDVRRIVRLKALDAGAVRPDGTIIYGDQEYIDRLHVRSDLYARHPDGTIQRLTVNQRLNNPDVRTDGAIVAVQTLPGTTRLALVSATGKVVTPLRDAPLDTQWTAPRWSPDGHTIAAILITHGTSEIALLDTTGHILQTFARSNAVTRSPTWSPDGHTIFFTSDRGGASEIYAARFPSGDVTTTPIITQRTDWPTGLFDVDALSIGVSPSTSPTPNLVSTVLRLDGLHVITLRPDSIRTIPTNDTTAAFAYNNGVVTQPAMLIPDTGKATPYSPWRTLRPAYWSPLYSSNTGYGALIGAVTTGEDVIGRHSYLAQAELNTDTHHLDALATYSYSRFLNPVFSLSAEQSWSYSGIYNTTNQHIGRLDTQTRLYSLSTTFERPRIFTYTALTLSAQLESWNYTSNPDTLLPQLQSFYHHQHSYPTVSATFQFSNTQRPTLSISPEDGIAFTLTGQQRWEAGVSNSASSSGVLVTTLYKSLDLPGYAHHVLALRAAGALTDNRSPGEYSVGGVSGSLIEIVPGWTIGDQPRTFPIRGFPPGTELGIRALTGTLEYRAPLTIPDRGLGLLPVFLNRTSLTLFADAGKASCPKNVSPPGPSVEAPACTLIEADNPILSSIGAELNLNTALQFDVPYLFRLGIAHPLSGRTQFGVGAVTTYLTLGLTF